MEYPVRATAARLTQAASVFFLSIALSSCSSVDAPQRSVKFTVPSASSTQSQLQSGSFATLNERFSALQRAYDNRSATDVELRDAFRAFNTADSTLRPQYDAWVAAFPKIDQSYTRLAGETQSTCRCADVCASLSRNLVGPGITLRGRCSREFRRLR